MHIFGIISPDVAEGTDIPLLLNFNPDRVIGKVKIEKGGRVTGEAEDSIRPQIDGRGYSFDVGRDAEGKPKPGTVSIIVT